ncbi:hypothetical protein CH49_601 [Yersinia enterocolitica]|nr:hypothetical protein CH49_601 [Yersinia enterocolitica]
MAPVCRVSTVNEDRDEAEDKHRKAEPISASYTLQKYEKKAQYVTFTMQSYTVYTLPIYPE